MKTFDLPASWDSKKFATRYNLDFNRDFYVDAQGKLVVFPNLLDNPPIFELPDPAPLPWATRVDAATTLADIKALLKELK